MAKRIEEMGIDDDISKHALIIAIEDEDWNLVSGLNRKIM
jgi:hypothetical protein